MKKLLFIILIICGISLIIASFTEYEILTTINDVAIDVSKAAGVCDDKNTCKNKLPSFTWLRVFVPLIFGILVIIASIYLFKTNHTLNINSNLDMNIVPELPIAHS